MELRVWEHRRLTGSSRVQQSNCDGGAAEGLGLLAVQGRRVVWYSERGGRVVKQFTCECDVLEAAFCTFSRGQGEGEGAGSDDGSRETAVCILLTPVHLRLHMNSGTNHDIQLPRAMEHMFAFSSGLLFQSERSADSLKEAIEDASVPTLYTLLHPYAPVCPIATPAMVGLYESPEFHTQGCDLFSNPQERVVSVHDGIVCTLRAEGPSSGAHGSAQTTAHLTLWSLVSVPQQAPAAPDTGGVAPPAQREMDAAAAASVADREMGLYFPFPASMANPPSAPSSSSRGRGSPGLPLLGSAASSPTMMDIAGGGGSAPGSGSLPGSGGRGGFKSISVFGGAGNSGGSGKRNSPSMAMMLSESVTRGGSPVLRRESPLSMLGGSAGSGAMPPLPSHSHPHQQRQESPAPTLAAILGVDSSSKAAQLARERNLPRPGPIKAGGSVSSSSSGGGGGAGATAASSTGSAGKRPASPDISRRSSPPWALRGLQVGGPGPPSQGGGEWMNLSHSGNIDSPGSPPPPPPQQQHTRAESVLDNSPAVEAPPIVRPAHAQSSKRSFFSTAPDFLLRLLDVATIVLKAAPEGEPASSLASQVQVQVLFTGGKDSLGGLLCHVLHAASGSYRCLSVELDGRVGCFGLGAEAATGGAGAAQADLPSGADATLRAALRPLPSLSAEGVQSMAHACQPLEGVEGVTLPIALLQSSAGRDFWLQLGSERVATTLLSMEDDLAVAGQGQLLCSTDSILSTRGRGDSPLLFASLKGECLMLSLGPSFDRAAGRSDVLLALLSAPQPSGAVSEVECNALNGLTVGVMLLAGRLYGPACGVLYVLLAAFGLSFPPLPPPALMHGASTSTSVSLPPKQRALQEQELAGCFSRLAQVCAAADASLPQDEPGVGALLFDAVHAAWQSLRLQASANANPNLAAHLADEAALLAAALALAASACASRAGSGAAVQAEARRYVQYYFERGCSSGGRQSWACPAVVSSFSMDASGAPSSIRPFTRRADVFCVSRWIGDCLARVCDPLSVLVPAPLPGRKHGERSLGLHPCPALRLVDRFLLLLHAHPPASDSAGASAVPLWWARAVVEAFLQATQSESGAADLASSQDPLGTLDLLPTVLRSLVNLALLRCREGPSPTWPAAVLKRMGREDVSAMVSAALSGCMPASHPAVTALRVSREARESQSASTSKGQELARLQSDGLAETEAASVLRFAEDERMHEVCRILCSSRKIYLRVDKAPETTDLDHRLKLQTRLLTLCRRTLALCVGRGMLTIRTLEPLMAASLPIPPLVLSGRVAPSNSIIQLDTMSVPAELTLWPEFHNGVAAGLRVGTNIGGGDGRVGGARQRVTRNWILYNRTASAAIDNGVVSHAGLLLALGLQRHLSVLSPADVCDYLTQGHEPTTIAVLIGMAAARRGSADSRTSKTLCLHLPALLPARHWDIEISPLVQIASLVGLGLLHAGSGHRLMAEFLLAELSRKPSSDRCDTREALSLAAAWALGVVLLGKGCKEALGVGGANTTLPASASWSTEAGAAEAGDVSSGGGGGGGGGGLAGLSDLCIEDRLHLHIVGGRRPPDSHLFPSTMHGDPNSRSSRVFEGSDINTDVTGPGATLALALIYMGSNNADIAARIALPQTAFALDAIRPDLLLYRALGCCLIMKDCVQLTDSWFDEGIPAPLRRALKLSAPAGHGGGSASVSGAVMCPRVALLAYACVTAGYCQGLGLAYAGTADPRAKALLLSRLRRLQSMRDNRPSFPLPFAMDKSLRPIIDMCVAAAATALACVMAGTGDLDCLRVFRELRFRVEDVTYGTHMALGMAVGLLFLAGGSASLKRDKLSVACLLLSIIPRFPAKATDNQCHLQALRHLYIVAVEERVLRTVDVSTGTAVSVGVEVVRTDGTVQQARAPCLLPDLATVAAVRVSGEAGAGAQEFFGTSINIAASGGRAHAQAQAVPTLVVQRRPQASASSSGSGSSSSSSEEKGEDRGEEAAYMALLLSAMRGESDVERAVSAGLEACGPLLGVLLDA